MLFAKDYVRFRLTGALGVEISDLSSGGLLDHRTGAPALGLLADMGLPSAAPLLSDVAVHRSTDVAGTLTTDAAEALGLRAGIPTAAGTMDGLALMIGSGVHATGQLSVIAGTWGINQVAGIRPVTDRSTFQSLRCLDDGRFLIVESTPNSMSNLDWLLNAFGHVAVPDGESPYTCRTDWPRAPSSGPTTRSRSFRMSTARRAIRPVPEPCSGSAPASGRLSSCGRSMRASCSTIER